MWSRDGKELFYRWGKQLLSVSVSTRPTLGLQSPVLLFEGDHWWQESSSTGSQFYDVAPDGNRFVMENFDQQLAPTEVHFVQNWFEELERLVPAGGQN